MTLPAAVIHSRLDADPSDSAARLLLAEHLAEHGDDVQARGLRWLAVNNKRPIGPGELPHYFTAFNPWTWWRDCSRWDGGGNSSGSLGNLADVICEQVGFLPWFRGFDTRRAAESAFCAALAATERSE